MKESLLEQMLVTKRMAIMMRFMVVSMLIINICKTALARRKKTKVPDKPIRNLVYSRPIQYHGRNLGNIELFDDEEPADSVGDFCELHDLPHDVYHGILMDACKQSVVVCTRAEPAKFKTPIFSRVAK